MSDHQLRIAGIRQRLDRCVEYGILRDWYSNGDNPGTRWHVEGGEHAIFSSRSYTTSQVEDFLVGALSGWYVGQAHVPV